ncbi:helix-turn-helix domain-containing protein [Kocuria sp.]|uniref:AraC-like ligand-binding domain-containing protein n=1 Tax=Kocuria sp. TaxID=1871328 RepID=UPI0026DF6A55|nr:helix-turn-helix domain-containing protein [Kocuria sp.]MDO5619625.1 helix-turn-helix domain-containing protein [Kocuria sp.]
MNTIDPQQAMSDPHMSDSQGSDPQGSAPEDRQVNTTRGQAMTMPQWRAAITRAIGQLTLSAPDESAFRAHLQAASLEDVHLFDMHTDAHTVVREPEQAAQTVGAHCKLSLQISGVATLTQDGRECLLNPGDLALYVTQRPYELTYPGPQHSLVVFFPQNFVHMAPEQISQVTATRVSRTDGLGRVAVPLFEQLAANIDLLHGAHAMSLVRSALDMLVTVLSAEAHTGAADGAENILLQQAMAYIDENLHDPDLSPSKIAGALYVSVRQLHSRFSHGQRTVSAYIRTRRLEAIRQDLADPLLSHESVQSISARHGLFDASYVSKALKSEYGEAPSAYRARVLGT